MFNFTNRLAKAMPIVTATSIALAGIITNPIQKADAQEINLDSLCSRYPNNSRCEDYVNNSKSESENVPSKSIRLSTLCEKFPLNSQCKDGLPQVMKIHLNSDSHAEWIRIEKQGDRVSLMHTKEGDGGLTSKVLNGAVGALVPIPMPFELKFGQWKDTPTTKVAFTPDGCGENLDRSLQKDSKQAQAVLPTTIQAALLNCALTGNNSVVLSPGTDIHAGLFTIEYEEGDLHRSITFRVPPEKTWSAEDRVITF